VDDSCAVDELTGEAAKIEDHKGNDMSTFSVLSPFSVLLALQS
jgi:hypothetical protein